MLDIRKSSSVSAEPDTEQKVAALASDAVTAVIETGAKILLAQPWRVARIVRGADEMTIDELTAHLRRRGRGGPPADLNLAIAVAQLSLALKSQRFQAVWASRRFERLPE